MSALKNWFERLEADARAKGYEVCIYIDGIRHIFVRVEDRPRGGVWIRYRNIARCGTVIHTTPRRNSHGDFFVRDDDGELVEICIEVPRKKKSAAKAPEPCRIGERFGNLVVKELLWQQGGSCLALCQCDCGGARQASVRALRSGKVISCGCRRGRNTELKLIVGEVFGRLTIIEQIDRPEGETRNEGYYRARCTCGNEVVRRREVLVRGDCPDCGCRGLGDLVGLRYGMVEILDETRRVQRHRQVKVRCQCGQVAWLRLNDLKTGKAKSCGCARGQSKGVGNADD